MVSLRSSKLAHHKTLTTKHTHHSLHSNSTHPVYPTSLLAHLHAHFTLTILCTTHPPRPLHPPPCTLHTNHPVHHSTHPPTHPPRSPCAPPTHPDHQHTYLLVGLFHNVSCLPLILLFESLRESIPLCQITLALLLCPAGTMPAHEQSSYSNGSLSQLSSLVIMISWFQPEFISHQNIINCLFLYLTTCILSVVQMCPS